LANGKFGDNLELRDRHNISKHIMLLIGVKLQWTYPMSHKF